jgi:hypothetical protein
VEAAGAAGSRGNTIVQPWLRSADWDLKFLVLSAALAILPYSIYAVFGGSALEAASVKGTAPYQARVLVNLLVALFFGGPHMYATFTRTMLDREYLARKWPLVAVSWLVPVAVITAAVASYESYVWLLSVFFALASLHALQQIVWLTEAYNLRARAALSVPSRLVDYAVVLTSLYPIAIAKMVGGQFRIGPVELTYGKMILGWYWLAYLAAGVFALALILFVAKTVVEARAGYVNVPKLCLISVTVLLMFWTPAFPNMDTAFQGINTWHSFQYLALTWYANKLREQSTGKPVDFLHWLSEQRGRAVALRGVVRHLTMVDRGSGWTTYYAVCVAMLPVSGLLIVAGSLIWPDLHGGKPGADEAYVYMGILSVLLVHYVQDAFLFADARSIGGTVD